MTDHAKLFRAISALESQHRDAPVQKWKIRKGTDTKKCQEIVEIGQQKLPNV